MPVTVQYCGVCGLPVEYCENGPSFQKCLPWLRKHAPDAYPAEAGEDKGKERDAGDEAGDAVAAVQLGDGGDGGEGGEGGEGGKKKKKKKGKLDPAVVISVAQRNKRKWITSIAGADLFDVKLADLSKACAKKFSSGCTVTKAANGKPASVDCQGDVQEEVTVLLLDKFGVALEDIVWMEGTKNAKRVPARDPRAE